METGEALIHADRLTGIIRLLEAEGCRLPSSDVWPESFSASSRSKNLAPLRPFLELHKMAANRDMVYELRDDMRAPLQRVVDSLDQMALSSNGRRQVTVAVSDDDGMFVVDGKAVTEKKLASAIKQALQTDD